MCFLSVRARRNVLDPRFLLASTKMFPTGQTEQAGGRSKHQKLCTCGRTVNNVAATELLTKKKSFFFFFRENE